MLDSEISLFSQIESLTIALGKSENWLLVSADHEGVGETGGEGVSFVVLDVDDLIRARVVLDGEHGAYTTDVVSASDEDSGEVLEFNDALDFTGEQVKLNASINIIVFRKELEKESTTLTLTVSFFFMSGWGKRMVLPSWVTMYGILFLPRTLFLTLQSLKLASLESMRTGV